MLLKRLLFIVIQLIVLATFFLSGNSYIDAHGTDTATYSTIILPKEGEKEIAVTITFPVAVAILVPKDGIGNENPAQVDYEKFKEEYRGYINRNFVIQNDGEECNLNSLDMPKVDTEQLMFGSGLVFELRYVCTGNVDSVVVRNTMFVDQLHHTNSISVYRENLNNLMQASLLTADVTSTAVGEVESSVKIDGSSKDDNYLSKLTSGLETAPLPLLMGIVFMLGLLHTLEAGHSKTILGGLLISRKVNLKQAIAYAAIFTATHIAPIILMGIILLIASSFTDVYTRLPYLQVFSLYTLFFISLYLVLKNVTEYIQQVVKRRKHNQDHINGVEHSHDHDHDEHHHHHGGHSHTHHEYEADKSFGQQLLMGFVAGLAPCLFGWSIFMVILSTKSVVVLFPVIISFALGIFIALVIFALIVWKLKKNFMKEGSLLSELSPIISSTILLIYSLSLIL